MLTRVKIFKISKALFYFFFQFGNDTSDPSNHDSSRILTPSEIESIESRMMLRNLHLTERCALYGLDQKGIKYETFIKKNLT